MPKTKRPISFYSLLCTIFILLIILTMAVLFYMRETQGSTTLLSELHLLTLIATIGFITALLMALITLFIIQNKARLEHKLHKRIQELQYLVNHDQLTRLPNRLAFNHDLTSKLKDDTPFSLVSFNIDKFKYINDTYGQINGDAILQHVAHTVGRYLNITDHLYRINGDQFLIISSLIDRLSLAVMLEKISNAVNDSHLAIEDKTVNCTISIGAACWNKETIAEIQKKSDSALYNSKANGQNCITIYE